MGLSRSVRRTLQVPEDLEVVGPCVTVMDENGRKVVCMKSV